jgi:hypothetical protein
MDSSTPPPPKDSNDEVDRLRSEPFLFAWAQIPSASDCEALGALRQLSPGAFHLAGKLGTLRTGTLYGHPAWLIRDQAIYSFEARRMDGSLWQGNKKSLALKGSKKNCPVGLLTLNHLLDELKTIVLVEGAPDYYAALALAIDSNKNFRIAAMLGSACNIDFDPAFACGMASCDLRGSSVLVIPHNDEGGLKAAARWSTQLYKLDAARVRIQQLPKGFKDLNEFVSQEQEAQCILDSISPQ